MKIYYSETAHLATFSRTEPSGRLLVAYPAVDCASAAARIEHLHTWAQFDRETALPGGQRLRSSPLQLAGMQTVVALFEIAPRAR